MKPRINRLINQVNLILLEHIGRRTCSNKLSFLHELSMTLKQSTQKSKHVLIELLTLTDRYSVKLHFVIFEYISSREDLTIDCAT